MPVEYHQIGTPREGCLCASRDGRLFTYDCDRNTSSWSGSLFQAILDKNLKLISSVRDNSVFESARSPLDGSSLMHYAVASGSLDTVNLVLGKMQRPHDPDSATGTRPLALACRYGYPDIVNRLVNAGAIVAAVDRRGNTCLHEAARFAQNTCLEVLLNTITADRYSPLLSHVLWMKNVEGHTCYDLAAQEGHSDTCELLMSYKRRSLSV